jgi:Fe-S-cluster containining protein
MYFMTLKTNQHYNQSQMAYPPPHSIHFTEHEERLPWLTILMDAYFIIDKGISEAIKREEKQGQRLACARGCSSCCRSHETIPVYPLELMAMSWYATEMIEGEIRQKLIHQLQQLESLNTCPFLIDNACSLHIVRPIACRSFNVFNQQCAKGEDAYYTRRADVLTPIKKYMDEAYNVMLPFYGIKNKLERRKCIKTGSIHQVAKVMRELNWSSLADKMNTFDQTQYS